MTLLDDDSLLVYRTSPGNLADLSPGDVILGFDGVEWRDLLDVIDEAKLPYCGGNGTTDASEDMVRMTAALANVHLFEEMDVRRVETDAVDHISTQVLLEGEPYTLACTDQMPIAGVEFPWTEYTAHVNSGANDVSGGIMPGTNIGYIYVYSWKASVEGQFEQMVASLMDTDALIIDTRFNLGGQLSALSAGMSLLFNQSTGDLGWMVGRDYNNPEDYHAMMTNYDYMITISITADEATYYDRPIAVLTGPKSVSGGDIFPYLMTHHPKVRRFGRPTAGAFGTTQQIALDGDIKYSFSPDILMDSDNNWVHRTTQSPEEEVWLTREDVASGVDTVVEAALDWIANQN